MQYKLHAALDDLELDDLDDLPAFDDIGIGSITQPDIVMSAKTLTINSDDESSDDGIDIISEEDVPLPPVTTRTPDLFSQLRAKASTAPTSAPTSRPPAAPSPAGCSTPAAHTDNSFQIPSVVNSKSSHPTKPAAVPTLVTTQPTPRQSVTINTRVSDNQIVLSQTIPLLHLTMDDVRCITDDHTQNWMIALIQILQSFKASEESLKKKAVRFSLQKFVEELEPDLQFFDPSDCSKLIEFCSSGALSAKYTEVVERPENRYPVGKKTRKYDYLIPEKARLFKATLVPVVPKVVVSEDQLRRPDHNKLQQQQQPSVLARKEKRRKLTPPEGSFDKKRPRENITPDQEKAKKRCNLGQAAPVSSSPNRPSFDDAFSTSNKHKTKSLLLTEPVLSKLSKPPQTQSQKILQLPRIPKLSSPDHGSKSGSKSGSPKLASPDQSTKAAPKPLTVPKASAWFPDNTPASKSSTTPKTSSKPAAKVPDNTPASKSSTTPKTSSKPAAKVPDRPATIRILNGAPATPTTSAAEDIFKISTPSSKAATIPGSNPVSKALYLENLGLKPVSKPVTPKPQKSGTAPKTSQSPPVLLKPSQSAAVLKPAQSAASVPHKTPHGIRKIKKSVPNPAEQTTASPASAPTAPTPRPTVAAPTPRPTVPAPTPRPTVPAPTPRPTVPAPTAAPVPAPTPRPTAAAPAAAPAAVPTAPTPRPTAAPQPAATLAPTAAPSKEAPKEPAKETEPEPRIVEGTEETILDPKTVDVPKEVKPSAKNKEKKFEYGVIWIKPEPGTENTSEPVPVPAVSGVKCAKGSCTNFALLDKRLCAIHNQQARVLEIESVLSSGHVPAAIPQHPTSTQASASNSACSGSNTTERTPLQLPVPPQPAAPQPTAAAPEPAAAPPLAAPAPQAAAAAARPPPVVIVQIPPPTQPTVTEPRPREGFLIPNLDQYFEDGRNHCTTADALIAAATHDETPPTVVTRDVTVETRDVAVATRDVTVETHGVTMTTRSSTRHDAARPGDSDDRLADPTMEGPPRPNAAALINQTIEAACSQITQPAPSQPFTTVGDFSFQRSATVASLSKQDLARVKECRNKISASFNLDELFLVRRNEIKSDIHLYLITVCLHDVLHPTLVEKEQNNPEEAKRLNRLVKKFDPNLTIFQLLKLLFSLIYTAEFKPLPYVLFAIELIVDKIPKQECIRVMALIEECFNLLRDDQLIMCRYFVISCFRSLILFENLFDKRLPLWGLEEVADKVMRIQEQNFVLKGFKHPDMKHLIKFGVEGKFFMLNQYVLKEKEGVPKEQFGKEFIANLLKAKNISNRGGNNSPAPAAARALPPTTSSSRVRHPTPPSSRTPPSRHLAPATTRHSTAPRHPTPPTLRHPAPPNSSTAPSLPRTTPAQLSNYINAAQMIQQGQAGQPHYMGGPPQPIQLPGAQLPGYQHAGYPLQFTGGQQLTPDQFHQMQVQYQQMQRANVVSMAQQREQVLLAEKQVQEQEKARNEALRAQQLQKHREGLQRQVQHGMLQNHPPLQQQQQQQQTLQSHQTILQNHQNLQQQQSLQQQNMLQIQQQNVPNIPTTLSQQPPMHSLMMNQQRMQQMQQVLRGELPQYMQQQHPRHQQPQQQPQHQPPRQLVNITPQMPATALTNIAPRQPVNQQQQPRPTHTVNHGAPIQAVTTRLTTPPPPPVQQHTLPPNLTTIMPDGRRWYTIQDPGNPNRNQLLTPAEAQLLETRMLEDYERKKEEARLAAEKASSAGLTSPTTTKKSIPVIAERRQKKSKSTDEVVMVIEIDDDEDTVQMQHVPPQTPPAAQAPAQTPPAAQAPAQTPPAAQAPAQTPPPAATTGATATSDDKVTSTTQSPGNKPAQSPGNKPKIEDLQEEDVMTLNMSTVAGKDVRAMVGYLAILGKLEGKNDNVLKERQAAKDRAAREFDEAAAKRDLIKKRREEILALYLSKQSESVDELAIIDHTAIATPSTGSLRINPGRLGQLSDVVKSVIRQ